MKKIALILIMFCSQSVYANDCSDFAAKIETVMRKKFPVGNTKRHYEMEAYNLRTQLKYIEQYKGCSSESSSYYKSKLDEYLASIGNPRPNPHDANTYEIEAYLSATLNSENSKLGSNNIVISETNQVTSMATDDPPVAGVKLSLGGETKSKKKSKKKN
jgi:hypothetical protein